MFLTLLSVFLKLALWYRQALRVLVKKKSRQPKPSTGDSDSVTLGWNPKLHNCLCLWGFFIKLSCLEVRQRKAADIALSNSPTPHLLLQLFQNFPVFSLDFGVLSQSCYSKCGPQTLVRCSSLTWELIRNAEISGPPQSFGIFTLTRSTDNLSVSWLVQHWKRAVSQTSW